MSETVIGIDLGTTNTCVCVHLNNSLKVLENSEGGRITPSYVYYTDSAALIIGQYAKKMADAKPEYGIYEIKRLVGRKFDDPYVKNNLNYLPFQVGHVSNEPVILIKTKNQIIKKRPQDICASILQKVKKDVEAKLDGVIDKAVITVPAYFNVAQREVTLAAAQQAGFKVLKLLNEPTAAAFSYYYENKSVNNEEETYSLVYDLGGGTFDVAILLKKGFDIKIVGVDGDTHLGGHDFDNRLVEHVCQILISKYSYNPKNTRREMRRLKNECEEAKKILSLSEETDIILNAFVPTEATVEIHVTREKFEEIAFDLFQQTIKITDRCLKKANLKKNDISKVILSGGSTRIPKIQNLLSEYFNGKTLCHIVHPDECVAEGAAIQAAMLSKDPNQTIKEIKITDVTSLSLGISNFVGLMSFLIKRNTPIPASNTTNRITVHDNQTTMTFDIYEGERLEAKRNHFLGVLEIENLTPAPPGQCSVSVTMKIDESGILTVSATETVSNVTKDVKFAYTRGTQSDDEINNVIVDAVENEAEDRKFKKFAEAKSYLYKYCLRAMYNFEQKALTFVHREAYDKCSDVLRFVKNAEVADESRVLKLTQEVRVTCEGFVKKYNFTHMP